MIKKLDYLSALSLFLDRKINNSLAIVLTLLKLDFQEINNFYCQLVETIGLLFYGKLMVAVEGKIKTNKLLKRKNKINKIKKK